MLLSLRSLWEEQAEAPETPPAVVEEGSGGHRRWREYFRARRALKAKKKKKKLAADEAIAAFVSPPVRTPPRGVIVAGWSVSPITPTAHEGFLVLGTQVNAASARLTPRIAAGIFHATLQTSNLKPQTFRPLIGYGKALAYHPPAVDPRDFTADDLPALALIIAEL